LRAPWTTLRPEPPERPAGLIDARGLGGHVVFNGRAVIIDRTHTDSFIVHGFAGPRVIPLHDLRAVRLRRPWAWFRGNLQFVRAGRDGGGRGGPGDPDTVAFDVRQRPQFEALVAALRVALEEQSISVLVTAVDDPREATRLAGLREQGLITEGEFQRLAARRKLQKIASLPALAGPGAATPPRAPAIGDATRQARDAFAERWLPDIRNQARA
jgi:hypothetical protein